MELEEFKKIVGETIKTEESFEPNKSTPRWTLEKLIESIPELIRKAMKKGARHIKIVELTTPYPIEKKLRRIIDGPQERLELEESTQKDDPGWTKCITLSNNMSDIDLRYDAVEDIDFPAAINLEAQKFCYDHLSPSVRLLIEKLGESEVIKPFFGAYNKSKNCAMYHYNHTDVPIILCLCIRW